MTEGLTAVLNWLIFLVQGHFLIGLQQQQFLFDAATYGFFFHSGHDMQLSFAIFIVFFCRTMKANNLSMQSDKYPYLLY